MSVGCGDLTGSISSPLSETASDDIIFGRQPVLEALRASRSLRRLLIARRSHGEAVDEIFRLARQQKVPFDIRDRAALDRVAGGSTHQGVVAYCAARDYVDFEELLDRVDTPSALLLFLDGVQDPHNLGAIVRSAYAAGASAVVLPARGSAGITATVVKASAGAIDYLPVSRVDNLVKALRKAAASGLWITGLVPGAERHYADIDYRGPGALVIGGEERGLRRLVREACDFQVGIPMARTEVGSLNASVAASLVLFEVFRQRTAAGER